jgi:hypothetical protein
MNKRCLNCKHWRGRYHQRELDFKRCRLSFEPMLDMSNFLIVGNDGRTHRFGCFFTLETYGCVWFKARKYSAKKKK